jgi:hypothetical protein
MKISKQLANNIGKKYNIDFNIIDKNQWHYGLNVELEHGTKLGNLTNITNNDIDLTARIVIAHLLESPDYYLRLYKMEKNINQYWSNRKKPNIFTVS